MDERRDVDREERQNERQEKRQNERQEKRQIERQEKRQQECPETPETLETPETPETQMMRELLAELRDALPPRLCAALESLFAARDIDVVTNPLDNFTRVAQPVARLPLWVAEAAAAAGSPVEDSAVRAAVAAAAAGYLQAQAHDAVVDEVAASPPLVLLAHALHARHHAALVEVAGAHAGFWPLFHARWLAYAEALLVERDAARGPSPVDAAAFDRILDRSRPLVLPGAALLARADRLALLPLLERLVHHTTRAAQLVDDLVDAEDDLAAGRRTYVTSRLGGERGLAELRRGLHLRGGFTAVTDEAIADLARAREAALALGSPAAARALDDDIRRVRALRRDTAAALAGQLFAPAAPAISR